ncbi:hypothetical protein ABFV99_13360 [Cytobacillus horneckiae]|uniref:hypothetical protein n=1 Tax=Cytobacillus horneckiae TaxID=549687 RepID=UPI0034CF3208
MNQVLFSETDSKGSEFTIQGDLEVISRDLGHLLNLEPDNEDYGINHVKKNDPWGDERWTEKERLEDEARLSAVLSFGYEDWFSIFNKITKKKNGTFAKNRVHVIHRGNTYAHYWEDSYGWNAPEVRIKSINDLTAIVSLDYVTEHY